MNKFQEFMWRLTGAYQWMHSMQVAHERACEEISQKTREYEQLKEHLAEVCANGTKLYETNKELSAKVTALDRLIASKDASIEQWTNDYNTIANRCTELEEQVDNLKAEAKNNFDKYDQANTALYDQKVAFEEIVKNLKSELEETRNKLATVMKQKNSLAAKIGHLTKKAKKSDGKEA